MLHPIQPSSHPNAETNSAPGSLSSIWRQNRLLILSALLFAMCLALYAPATGHHFINFDDDRYVYNNVHVMPGLTLAGTQWAFHTFEMGHWHPLTWLSHMLDCQFFDGNAASHHFSNTVLHALNGLLLFLLLARATGSVWRSFLVAALFLVHPLNVESVAWVAERKTLLSTFFTLITIVAYGWYSARRGVLRYMVVILFFLMALMSKAMAVTLPVILLLIDYWPLETLLPRSADGEPARVQPATRLLVLEKLPLLLLSFVFSIIAVLAQRSTGTLNTAMPLAIRLENSVVAYVTYIGKMFWPSHLSIFYPYAEQGPRLLPLVLSLALLGLLTFSALRLKQCRYLIAGWLYFLVALLPVIGVIQVGAQSMADRYAYTPLIGLFLVLVWGLGDLVSQSRLPVLVPATVALLVLLAFSFTTRTNLAYWQDSLTLFSRAEQLLPVPDRMIETNLGEAYDDAGKDDIAVVHYHAALAVDPHCYLALYDLGNYMLRHGRPADAVQNFKGAVQYSGSPMISQYALHNMGSAYMALSDFPHAESSYSDALRYAPSALPSIAARGQAYYEDGKFAEAEVDFLHALQLRRVPSLYLWLGKTLEGEKRFAEAADAYSRALQGDSSLTEAQARLASLHASAAHP